VKKLLSVSLIALLSSCISVERDFAETSEVLEKGMPLMSYESPAATGSIYRDQMRSSQFGFRKNFSMGDIITVVLDESTQAQRSSGINMTKEVSNLPLSQLQAAFGNALPINSDPEIRLKRGLKALSFTEQKRSDKGLGTADQAASLNGAVAVIVTRVLPNGTLFVEGKKDLVLSEGREEIYISGLVMPDDVQPDNTVLSSRIAQASIAYRGKGDLADVARASWGTKVFNKIWPF